MSVSAGPSGGKYRRKEVDSDLNLTPYIDLLTCMVAFLLIAAVWTQLARLSVAQKGQGDSETTDVKELPRLAIAVHGEGFNVIVKDDQKPIPRTATGFDFARLADELKLVKHAHEDQTTMQILSDDTVVFETLVRTMDVAMSAGFPDVSLLDSGAAP